MSLLADLQPLVNRVRGTGRGHSEETDYGWIAKGMKDHYRDLVQMTWNVLQLNHKFGIGIIVNSTEHDSLYGDP